MAELSKSGKRLIIPIEVWIYKGKDDIQFTSNDKDFGNGNGVRFAAKPGTKTYDNARSALEKYGILEKKMP